VRNRSYKTMKHCVACWFLSCIHVHFWQRNEIIQNVDFSVHKLIVTIEKGEGRGKEGGGGGRAVRRGEGGKGTASSLRSTPKECEHHFHERWGDVCKVK
jgi:hypothetical protein